MNFNIKTNNLINIKLLLKNKIFILCYVINSSTNNFIKLKQKILKNKAKLFNLNSSLINYLFKKSIYSNLNNLSFGSITLLYFNQFLFFKKIFNFNNIKNNNKYYSIVCIIFNKKLYNINFLFYLKTLKYVNNINLLYKYFKKYLVYNFLPLLLLVNKNIISK